MAHLDVLARQQARQAEGAPAAPLDLVALARTVIGEAVADAQARSQEIGLSGLETALVTGHADALRLLLRNLVENAIKYAPAGGRIEVGVVAGEAPGRRVLVVEDSGPGIPEAERSRVLDRFYRLPDAPSTGSGLGLAITKWIVDAHGGTIRCTNSELGGAAFEVTLPRHDHPHSS